MYLDQPLSHFLDQLANKSAVPGGGSVAALVGALGAGLVSMVTNLTIGKEKYQNVQPQIETLLGESEKLRLEMQDLIQKDTEVFGALSEVYRMPKSTEVQKTIRNIKMQEALKSACQVPLDIGVKALDVAKLAQQAADIGNEAVISDAGVAVILAQACAQSVALNMKTNIKNLRDESYNQKIWAQMQNILQQVSDIEKSVLETIYWKMG
jgi:glutamate formiminotransferase/formiminotetrahydrofolate cyclodeaminase